MKKRTFLILNKNQEIDLRMTGAQLQNVPILFLFNTYIICFDYHMPHIYLEWFLCEVC